ncbi:MAG: HAMP domain-containing sensor histidine kinase [Candidatus Binatus sp.]|uniref:sensor histidine kinase n=1 Tax=Candidatus Binatus sp. TaxID=2811406 RepID=UPI0027245B3D|nr:HAMP domain-containing sensor histidine kinase [Candidatus Binatus sp.]MDO8435003.1 HAMP domain-containing sensor histidine kinase [Candidatus Binatus sp.]
MNVREVEARSAPRFPDVLRTTSELEWTKDDEESLRTIKLGTALGVLMLVAYLEYDLRIRGHGGIGATFHWIILGGTAVFFGTLWTRAFRRQWKLWTFSISLFLMWMFTIISASTRDPESRFITMALCPMATASFVNWGPRWQFSMAAISLATFSAAQYFVPIENPFIMYQWLGLVAALGIAQFTAIYIDRYRRRLSRQVEDLEEAARFRQNQIATMAHDIRSPVAALSGYVNLLEEDHADAKERADVLGRIGSTAWYMDLLVSNVLDLYQVQERNIVASPIDLDPNLLLAEITADCAVQARRRHLSLRTEFSSLPPCRLDPRHFERIVRNLIAFAIVRSVTDEVVLRTALRGRWIVVEVTDDGPSPTPDELATLFDAPSSDGRRGRARGLGLYIARAMARAAGGRIEARYAGARGITLTAELPIEAAPRQRQLD